MEAADAFALGDGSEIVADFVANMMRSPTTS